MKSITQNTKRQMTFPNAPLAFFFGAFVTGPLFYLFISILIGIPTLLLLANLQATIPFFILLAAVKSPITMGMCGMLGGLGMLCYHNYELSTRKPSTETTTLVVGALAHKNETLASDLVSAPNRKSTPTEGSAQAPAQMPEALVSP